jgi:YVTN family beta-propeller protein
MRRIIGIRPGRPIKGRRSNPGYISFAPVVAAALAVLAGGCASTRGTSNPGTPSTTASPSETIGIVSRTQVGNAPVFAAQDQKTQTLYVTNSGSNTVSVVNKARCSSLHASGCARHWPVVAVGSLPLGMAVDQATDTVYVANANAGTISVIDGATCSATDTSGCGQKPTTVSVGAFADAVAMARTRESALRPVRSCSIGGWRARPWPWAPATRKRSSCWLRGWRGKVAVARWQWQGGSGKVAVATARKRGLNPGRPRNLSALGGAGRPE